MKMKLGVFLFIIPLIAGTIDVVPINEKTTGTCQSLFKTYGIDPDIKSYKGWMRVCKNGKINLYSKYKLSSDIRDGICGCFKSTDRDRDLEVKR